MVTRRLTQSELARSVRNASGRGSECGAALAGSAARNRELGRELPGMRITGVAKGDGRLWAGSWKHGVQIRSDGEWWALDSSAGLPDNSVSDLAITDDELLWVAVYGDGVSRMPTAQIVE